MYRLARLCADAPGAWPPRAYPYFAKLCVIRYYWRVGKPQNDYRFEELAGTYRDVAARCLAPQSIDAWRA